MKEIFDSYVETSFDHLTQSETKIEQLKLNYLQLIYSVDKKVLDIGIGRGELLSIYKSLNKDYLGIDISPSTIKHCSALNLKCELVEDTAKWLKNNPQSFEFITLLDVLEHVPRSELIEFLKSIYGALEHKGVLVVQVPNLQAPFGYLHHFNDVTHVTGFVEHSLGQVMKAAGFINFEFKGYEEIIANKFKHKTKKFIRKIYWNCIRFLRFLNNSPNPNILTPVIFCIARKK